MTTTTAVTLLDEALQIAHVRSYQGQFENGIAHGIATIILNASMAAAPPTYD